MPTILIKWPNWKYSFSPAETEGSCSRKDIAQQWVSQRTGRRGIWWPRHQFEHCCYPRKLVTRGGVLHDISTACYTVCYTMSVSYTIWYTACYTVCYTACNTVWIFEQQHFPSSATYKMFPQLLPTSTNNTPTDKSWPPIAPFSFSFQVDRCPSS